MGGRSILYHHKGSHITALHKLYPELMLKPERFFRFKAPELQRAFFDDFAKSKLLDPLNATHWYSVTWEDIINAGGGGILHHYERSHIIAIMQIYPEIMMKKENFFKWKWKSPNQHRKFLNDFAKDKQFDPLDAAQWQSITNLDIVNAVSCLFHATLDI